jgi:NADH:ubiquinone oxidoreductase subunit E
MEFEYLKELEPQKKNLIKGLQKIQEIEGYVSNEALAACSQYFGSSLADAEGVVSFYSQFRRTAPGKYKVNICDGTACHIKGSGLIEEWIGEEIGIKSGETDDERLFSLNSVSCLGCCSLAPVIAVNGEVFANMDRKKTIRLLKNLKRQG